MSRHEEGGCSEDWLSFRTRLIRLLLRVEHERVSGISIKEPFLRALNNSWLKKSLLFNRLGNQEIVQKEESLRTEEERVKER